MDLIHTISDLHERLRNAGPVAFVPTMGNLHAGHLQLVRAARAHAATVVASIFVNPLQFGPQEDFNSYPRTLAADCEQLRAVACDVVFAPSVSEMYPVPQQIEILPPAIASDLCGVFRPGHFQGVATVVAKLLNIVQPTVALFGKKDYQQLFVIQALVQQLNFPVRIVAAETARADDDLALSSRNGYLSASQRQQAPQLYQTLKGLAGQLASGNREFAALEQAACRALVAQGWRVDYIAVRAADTLLAPSHTSLALVVLGAAWLGQTRLIDNVEVTPGAERRV